MQFVFQKTLGKVNRQFTVVLLMAVGASLFALNQVGFSQQRQQQSGSHPPLAASPFELVPAIPPAASEVIVSGTAELEGVDRDLLLDRLLNSAGDQQDRFKNAVFFRIDFGEPSLPSLVVMQTADEPDFLYVDSNRDLKFQTSERLPLFTPTATAEVASKADGRSSVKSWICNIYVRPAEQNDRATEDNQEQHQQATANTIPVRFRRLSADQLGLATAAHLSGMVYWQGEYRLAKIEDRNANGRWFDSTDRLFVDLNGDGKIDPLLERLPASGMRKIGNHLIAIGKSDDGQSIRLEIVKDRGWIEPKLDLEYWDDVEIVSSEVVFASQAGFLTETKSIDKALEVPIGMWGVHSVTLAIAAGEQVYEFSFYAGANRKLHEIQSGETLEMDLLGGLELTAQVALSRSATRSQISITPSLITESGLFLRGASIRSRDSSAPKKENRLTCVSFGGGEQVGLGSSGFS